MKGNKIDFKDIIDSLNNDDLAKVSKAIKDDNFSRKEIESIQNNVDDLLLIACKTKLRLELRFLAEEQPDLALRDVVIKMLNLLPEDVEESHITFLTEFIMDKWKSVSGKLAA